MDLELPDFSGLARLPLAEQVRQISAADATVPLLVGAAADEIAAVVTEATERLRAGGRLIYVGAGAGGRIAAQDAAECGPTFNAPPGQVVAVIAGGERSLLHPREDLEDDPRLGRTDLAELTPGRSDLVVGVSASGATPYVVGAMEFAASCAATAAIVCRPASPLARIVDRAIVIDTGAEAIAGSTRLRAGTAQKLVLNLISTLTMMQLGHTWDNLMIDVVATNAKLRARARSIVVTITGCSEAVAQKALAEADGEAKTAVVMLLAGVEADTARKRLASADGVAREAI